LVLAIIAVCHSNTVLRGDGGMRLIEFNESVRVWMTEEEVSKLVECIPESRTSFMDITDNLELGMYSGLTANPPIPTKPTHQTVVRPLLQNVDEQKFKSTISTLSSYSTRYYTSTTAVESAKWLAGQYTSFSSHRNDTSVRLYQHTWVQPSVIARIEGSGPNKNEIVVIGGHIDSTTKSGNAPGADDDASGSATVLEAFRVLAQSNFKPSRSIEFHGYAAEEVGLRGSQAIAQDYAKLGVIIAGAMQLDMDAYYKPGTKPTIVLVTDYVSKPLTDFLEQLVLAYTTTPVSREPCGYACSDHASWNKAGYNACYPFEALVVNENKQIHTSSDTLSLLNLPHAMEFVRLAISFAVELGLNHGPRF